MRWFLDLIDLIDRATERRVRHLDPTPLSWTQRILQLLAVRS